MLFMKHGTFLILVTAVLIFLLNEEISDAVISGLIRIKTGGLQADFLNQRCCCSAVVLHNTRRISLTDLLIH
jgi:hypothetical protein